MEKQFEKILDKDEKIIKVVKPIKSKLYFATLVNVILVSLAFSLPMIFAMIAEFRIVTSPFRTLCKC